MTDLAAALESLASETGFSGAVRVDGADGDVLEKAYGLADRAHRVANTVDTRFGIASAVKGMTALAVVSLVADQTLQLGTTARSLLGSDLPLVADDVTVEHLLAHRSGIGDYLDEDELDDIDEYVLTVGPHELAATEDFLRVVDGHPTKFPAGERFSYSNGGYVVLALIAERASGTSFHDLVEQRVCAPAGMHRTAFLRSDELPGDAAVGYLNTESPRTNVFHLPVRGNGDGGIYSTVDDLHRLWGSLFDGRIIPPEWVDEMVRPRSDVPSESKRYGLGLWLHAFRDVVHLEGYDAGVSARTVHDPTSATTFTVLSNTSDGAWPIARHLASALQL